MFLQTWHAHVSEVLFPSLINEKIFKMKTLTQRPFGERFILSLKYIKIRLLD